mgnify:CR=1 FL=1
MAIFPHVEGIYNSVREMRSLSYDLYYVGKKLDKLKAQAKKLQAKASAVTSDKVPKCLIRKGEHMTEAYNKKAARFGTLAKSLTDQLVKINAHLRQMSKEFGKS